MTVEALHNLERGQEYSPVIISRGSRLFIMPIVELLENNNIIIVNLGVYRYQ